MSSTGISKFQRSLITVAVMAATLMQVLDTSIMNVALPDMQGAFGATPDQITWVLTSYLVASGIFMPLTGYLDDRLGRRVYLLSSVFGFVFFSMLCGAASSLDEMVIFRVLQGISGAALVPLSQAILADIYSEEERGKAMALWGIGVMVGPVLGPTLGGYLTEVINWRWVFYVNVPVGLLSWALILQTLPSAPKKSRAMDWWGLLLLSTAIGCVQYVLDRGNQQDWFDSRSICITAFFAIASSIAFLAYNLLRDPNKVRVFDLTIFSDRNFAISSFLLLLFGLGLSGSLVILPLMLENLMNYPVLTTGLVMAPRGISGMIGMIIVGRLIKTVDARVLIFVGIIIGFIGNYASTSYNLEMNIWEIVWPLFLQGLGIGFIFIPLTMIAFSTLPEKVRAEAAGLFSLMRVMGLSAGISIIITTYSRHAQMAWNQLGGRIQTFNPAVSDYLHPLHLHATQPKAALVLSHELFRQSQIIAFVDCFALICAGLLLMLPFLLLLKKNNIKSSDSDIEQLSG